MSTSRTRRARRITPRNFYRSALDEAEQEALELAGTDGLDDEVALLRLLVRRELAERPENLKLILQGVALLVRAIAARYRLSPADQAELEQRIVEAMRTLTIATVEGAGDA